MFDFYNDPGWVKIGQYTIANISEECEGDHTFLHALEYSCNVGMVRIAQAMTKYVFYSYLEKLGFGELTGIELAGEDSGTLPDFNFVSVARFFNNTYGQ
jgi:cell division protein FtsI/penicillin-binding protein 2